MKLLIISAIVVVSLGGCITPPKPKPPIEVVDIDVKPAPNIPVPNIKPTSLKPVNWDVSEDAGSYSYTVDQDGFDALLHNVQDLRRYILDQKSIINYLLPFINKNEKPLPDAGSK